jgi:DNA-binding MarR family transcriptional regulator
VTTEGAATVPLIIADIYQLAGQLRRNADAITQPLGQTQARWQVLSAASAEPKTVPQLARRLGIARQSVQRTADLLVADGLASFAPNPEHKSSPHLLLTPEGRAVLVKATALAGAYYAELVGALASGDLAALRRGLRALCEVLDRRDEIREGVNAAPPPE